MADAILNQNLKFEQLINVDSISEVTVNNNYGSVKLNSSQLKKIRKEFSAMTLHWCCPTKPGAISIKLTIADKKYYGYSTTGSNLVFFDDLPINYKSFEYIGPEYYFQMPNKMNFNNYK